MDLFVVNRFEGDNSVNTTSEETNLSKLLNSIKSRQKLKDRGKKKKEPDIEHFPECNLEEKAPKSPKKLKITNLKKISHIDSSSITVEENHDRDPEILDSSLYSNCKRARVEQPIEDNDYTRHSPGSKKRQSNKGLGADADQKEDISVQKGKKTKKQKIKLKKEEHIDYMKETVGHQEEDNSVKEEKKSKQKKIKIEKAQNTDDIDIKETDDQEDAKTNVRKLRKLKNKARRAEHADENGIKETDVDQEDNGLNRKRKSKKQKAEERKAKFTDDSDVKEANADEEEEDNEERKGKQRNKIRKLEHAVTSEKYTTLGEQTFVPRGKAKHKSERDELLSAFPKWLSEPTMIDSHFDQPSHTVDDIPMLAPWLVEKLKKNGVKHFFPVQYAVIPAVLEVSCLPPQNWPRDMCISSPTGSGKTLAFVLPIVQALSGRVVPAIRALIVLPTQDLAAQVARVFRQFVLDTALRVKLLSVESFEAEQRSLCFYSELKKCYESRVDIVVTTPGRLVEHLNNTPGFSLDNLRYLIVDEADLLIERSQHDWMLHLEKRLSTGRSEWKAVPPATSSVLESVRRPPHRLYFSATLSHDPEVLSKMRLFQPRLFSVARFKVYDVNKSFTAADGVVRYEHSKRLLSDLVVPRQLKQFYVECDLATKPLQLYQLLMANDWDAVIVFANSVEAVHRLVTLLRLLGEGSLTVAEISSAVSPDERMTSARDFLRGKVRVLVSTDSFARGIDLPNVKCVISYEVPLIFQIYVHRVGRTCRAGLPGCAVTMVDSKSSKHFHTSLSFFKKRKYLTKMEAPPNDNALNGRYQEALKDLEKTISNEKSVEIKKRKEVKKLRIKKPVLKKGFRKSRNFKRAPRRNVRHVRPKKHNER